MRFKHWDCNIKIAHYGNGNTAILLNDKRNNEPVATATINFDEKLPENQAYIKDYSENEGMLEALKEAGIVIKVLGHRHSGYIIAPLCELNMDILTKTAV